MKSTRIRDWAKMASAARRHVVETTSADFEQDASRNFVAGVAQDDDTAFVVHFVRNAGERSVCGLSVNVGGFGSNGSTDEREANCPTCIATRESSPRMPIKRALPREDESDMDVTLGKAVGR